MFAKIRRLLSHTLIYGLGNSGNRLVGFILLPIYTRYMTPEDYGVLALVAMLGQVLFTLMSVPQGTAVFKTYFTHDEPERREAVITTSLWLILTLSFPLGLLALSLAKPLGAVLTGRPEYTVWVMLGIGGVAFKVLLRLPFSVLRAREESWRYASCSFAQTVASLVLAIVFVAGLHLGGRGVLLSQLVAELLLCAYLLPPTLKGLRFRFSGEDARELLGYSVYLIPTTMLGFLLHMSDRYFLKHFASLSDVGLYALGYRLGEVLAFAIWAFALAWPPFVFEQRKSPDAPIVYARVSTYFVAVMGFLWLTISLLAEEIVVVMARPAFYDAYRVVPWIAAAFLFQALAHLANIGILLHRKVKYRPAIVGTAAAVNLGLNFVLVPRYGMMGAGVASCVSFFIWFVLQAMVSHRLYPIPYEYARVARLVVVGVALYAAGSLIAWGSIPVAVAGKGLLLLAAPLLLYATGFFEPGELGRLRRSVTRLREWPVAVLQARNSGR